MDTLNMRSRVRDPYARFCGQSEAAASPDPIQVKNEIPRYARDDNMAIIR